MKDASAFAIDGVYRTAYAGRSEDEFEQNRQGRKEKKRNEIKDNQNNV